MIMKELPVISRTSNCILYVVMPGNRSFNPMQESYNILTTLCDKICQ